MKLREIAVAVAALSLAGTAMAAGNDARSTTSERLPTARQGQPLDQSTQATQEPQGSNAGNSASTNGSGSAKMDNGNATSAANAGSQGNMANEEHNPQLVRSAQQALKQKGYDVGAIDGQLGPSTESALRQFQQSQGITRSGNLDQQTLSALGVDENHAAQGGISSPQSGMSSQGGMSSSQSGMSSSQSGMSSSQGAQGSRSSGQTSQPASSTQGSAYK